MQAAPAHKSPRWWLSRLGAAALAAVLLAAGIAKAADPAQFFRAIETYRAFPTALAVALAYFVPALEIIAGAALLHPRWRRAGALLALLMLTMFLMLITVSWARGLDIACGCFGGGEAAPQANYPWLVARNLGLLALAAAVFYASRSAAPDSP